MHTEQSIRLWRMGPMQPAASMEFLWALHVGEPEEMSWAVEREGDAVTVRGQKGKRRIGVRFDRAQSRCVLI